MKRSWLAAAAAAAVILGTASAWSQGPGGEMGGFGMGGMMGQGMMGQGMMGRGMMGPGMMGPGPGAMWGIDLSSDQREKIAAIRRDAMRAQWDAMSKLHERGGPMYQAYASGEFDEQAARKAYDAMAQAHRQMFESQLETRKRIESMLTDEQRKKLRGDVGHRHGGLELGLVRPHPHGAVVVSHHPRHRGARQVADRERRRYARGRGSGALDPARTLRPGRDRQGRV